MAYSEVSIGALTEQEGGDALTMFYLFYMDDTVQLSYSCSEKSSLHQKLIKAANRLSELIKMTITIIRNDHDHVYTDFAKYIVSRGA